MVTRSRLVAGAAAGAALVLGAAGPASAQAYPPTGGGGTVVVTTPITDTVQNPASLPRTGQELLTALAIGLGAVTAGGTVLLAARRRARA